MVNTRSRKTQVKVAPRASHQKGPVSYLPDDEVETLAINYHKWLVGEQQNLTDDQRAKEIGLQAVCISIGSSYLPLMFFRLRKSKKWRQRLLVPLGYVRRAHSRTLTHPVDRTPVSACFATSFASIATSSFGTR